jgi:ABC-type sugar transport system substrate-binding protein
MQKVNRRSAVALGLAAASAAMVKPAASQTTDIVGKDATKRLGVTPTFLSHPTPTFEWESGVRF